MANITAQMVKELRESTGAGMMDCKKALQEAEGNMEKAVDILREKRYNQFIWEQNYKEQIQNDEFALYALVKLFLKLQSHVS